MPLRAQVVMSKSASIPVPNKTHKVEETGNTYAYIHHPASNPEKETLLFIHGFPSTSHDWQYQVEHFGNLGYGILVPDCLGYGGTSKPNNPESYIGKSMASEIISILDAEKLDKVVGIGHDWGVYLLSRLEVFYSNRFSRLVFCSSAFIPPGIRLNVVHLNQVTKKTNGYEIYGYWIFFTKEGAGEIINKHRDKFFNMVYPADAAAWKTGMAGINQLETYLTTPSILATPVGPWISDADRAQHKAAIKDITPALNYYKRAYNNLGVDDEKALLDRGAIKNTIEKKTLMICGLYDAICGAQMAKASMEAVVKGGDKGGLLKVVNLEAGHWLMSEQKEEFNRELEKWLAS